MMGNCNYCPFVGIAPIATNYNHGDRQCQCPACGRHHGTEDWPTAPPPPPAAPAPRRSTRKKVAA